MRESEFIREKPYSKGELQLIKCPACFYRFEGNEKRHQHFLDYHTPADFGLTPYKPSQPAGSSVNTQDRTRIVDSPELMTTALSRGGGGDA